MTSNSNVLNRHALVLNRSWQAINVITVARSLAMVYSNAARVVHPHTFQLMDWDDWSRLEPSGDEPFVQAVTQRFCVPEVVALNQFDLVPISSVTFSRRNIFKRDRFTCQYCGRQPDGDELTIDHVVPRSQGGPSTWENCVLACMTCNNVKADRTPQQARMKLRKQPVRPKWNPSFTRTSIRLDSWRNFISEAYWNVELE
ncbi:MAG TPA: HNH endonuclease [Pirellulaceae bacterium]|nr:HNH endonuclease [Pirellulaceae bacterium]HMO93372.1 HNH endonuclease [Pirellulaceae bacterium]HMP70431.1 HNH endonuclease [Pirellulaceae bacterium]